MAYFKIGDVDFSAYVNALKVTNSNNYTALTNANGDTVVDYINNKRTLEVGIIPLDDTAMAALQSAIDDFSVSISFRNPRTNELEANVSCIIPTDTVEYYTIQVGKVMYKAFVLQFIEL